MNPESVIGYLCDSKKSIKHVHVFPRFMNAALKFVRPVISLDAAHLKSSSKGTMYVALVLSGTNEVYPIDFMISAGNADGKTWTTINKTLLDYWYGLAVVGYCMLEYCTTVCFLT